MINVTKLTSVVFAFGVSYRDFRNRESAVFVYDRPDMIP